MFFSAFSFRRASAVHSVLTVAAVCAAVTAMPTAHAQQSSGSTLELELNTGSGTASRTGSTRGANVRAGSLPSLSSRGTFDRSAIKRVTARSQATLGKLGVILTDKAALRVGRDKTSRALSSVAKGTNLAVVSESGDYYGVLMVDGSTGWVPKANVNLIDYQVEVQVPPTSAAGNVSGSVGRAGAGSADQWAEGLAPRQQILLREAFTYLGVPYVWAGNTRRGIDCSGFLKAVFASQGVSLPRHSGDQARVGQSVAWQDLQAGDRLYFAMKGGQTVSHCGIYLGNGYFIHSSTNHKGVDVDSIMKPGYYRALVCARRSL